MRALGFGSLGFWEGVRRIFLKTIKYLVHYLSLRLYDNVIHDTYLNTIVRNSFAMLYTVLLL